MFDSSKDILYLSLALSAVVATGFWVALLWYIIKIFRTVGNTIEDFRDRLHTIDDILQTIKEKLTSTHVQLAALSEGVAQLVTMFMRRRRASRSSSRASDEADDV
jgi:uncharacterized protein YoxC